MKPPKAIFLKPLSIIFLLSVCFTLTAQQFEYVDSGTNFILYDVSIPPGQDDIAYAAGAQFTSNSDGIIIKSIDGGFTWSTIYPTSGTVDGIEKIEFLDEMTGYAVGYDLFIKTIDGGVTWTDVVVAADVWYYKSLNFYDSNIGIVTVFTNGSGFEVYTTADGGLNWSPITNSANMPTFAVDYADATTLYAVGANEVISKSTDSGDTWVEIQSGTPTFFNLEVFFSDADNGVVSGEDGTLLTTHDGGITWDTYSNGYHNFYGLGRTFSGDLYAAGTDQDVYISTDDGANWSLIHDGENIATFYDIEYFADGNGLICGSQGRMLHFTLEIIGYDDHEFKSDLDMIYNPKNALLEIVSSEVINEVTLYTLDGKQLLKQVSNSTFLNVDTSTLADGPYLVRVKIGGRFQSLKFMKY